MAKVVDPVANVVITLANVIVSVPGVIAALPGSPTPVYDVIAAVQAMLTSVADAIVPLAQLPSDLFSLLGVTGVAPPMIGVGAAHQVGLFGTPAAPTPQMPLFP